MGENRLKPNSLLFLSRLMRLGSLFELCNWHTHVHETKYVYSEIYEYVYPCT